MLEKAYLRGLHIGDFREAAALAEKALWNETGDVQRCERASRAALKIFHKNSEPALCLMTLALMREAGVLPNSYHCLPAMQCLVKNGADDEAIYVFDTLQKDAGGPVAFDPIIYNTALQACANKGDWTKADALLGDMSLKDVEPEVRTFRLAIQALQKGSGPNWRILGLWRQYLWHAIKRVFLVPP